jgi:lactoylglutathione lyase
MIPPSSENEGIRIIAEFDDIAIPLNATSSQTRPITMGNSGSGEVNGVAVDMLNLVVLFSADPDRVARFYGLLGIHFEQERHGTGPEHLAGKLGAQVLEIYPQSGNAGVTEVRLGFSVNSVDAVVNAVRQAGGCVVSAPCLGKWGYRAVLADPEGRRVEILQGK